jgi:hypothetical protein
MVSALVVGTNTYVTLAESNTYLGDSVRAAAWDFLDDDSKMKALITAARIFEKQAWEGEPTNPPQALHFPATGVTDKYDNPVDPNTVPQPIKDGQIEFAFDLSQDASLETTGGTGSNVQSLGAGSARISYFRPTGGVDGTGSPRFSPDVLELIGPYLSGSGELAQPFASGTDVTSVLTDGSDYDFNRGLP